MKNEDLFKEIKQVKHAMDQIDNQIIELHRRKHRTSIRQHDVIQQEYNSLHGISMELHEEYRRLSAIIDKQVYNI